MSTAQLLHLLVAGPPSITRVLIVDDLKSQGQIHEWRGLYGYCLPLVCRYPFQQPPTPTRRKPPPLKNPSQPAHSADKTKRRGGHQGDKLPQALEDSHKHRLDFEATKTTKTTNPPVLRRLGNRSGGLPSMVQPPPPPKGARKMKRNLLMDGDLLLLLFETSERVPVQDKLNRRVGVHSLSKRNYQAARTNSSLRRPTPSRHSTWACQNRQTRQMVVFPLGFPSNQGASKTSLALTHIPEAANKTSSDSK